MEEISFSDIVVISALKYQAWHGIKPIIVIGSETIKELVRRDMFPYTIEGDERANILTFKGFQVEYSEDFDYGFFIRGSK
jgi:hypothetical protein